MLGVARTVQLLRPMQAGLARVQQQQRTALPVAPKVRMLLPHLLGRAQCQEELLLLRVGRRGWGRWSVVVNRGGLAAGGPRVA